MFSSLCTRLGRALLSLWLILFPAHVDEITVTKMRDLYMEDDGSWKGIQLIDIRSREAFAVDHIPGAINIPLDELLHGALTLDLWVTTIVYCYKGVSSRTAALLLQNDGFEHVLSLQGGWERWQYWSPWT
jgi:rhodanese-related sulfurtransferase